MTELQSCVSGLVGERCSRARVRPGRTLILDFGEFRPLRASLANPGDRGAWVVVAWEALVRLEFASGETIEGDPDRNEHLPGIAQTLIGTVVTEATVAASDLHLSLVFSDGTRLHLVPGSTGDDEQWSVLSPDSGNRTVVASGGWHARE